MWILWISMLVTQWDAFGRRTCVERIYKHWSPRSLRRKARFGHPSQRPLQLAGSYG